MPNTTYFNDKIASHVTGKAAYTLPGVYLGLSTSTPVAAGTGVTEPVGNGYARIQVPASSLSASSGGVVTNSVDINFTKATADWSASPITTVVAFDALTGGNLLWHAPLTSGSRLAQAGDKFSLEAGAFSYTSS